LLNLCQGVLKLFWQLVQSQRPIKTLYVGVSFIFGSYLCVVFSALQSAPVDVKLSVVAGLLAGLTAAVKGKQVDSMMQHPLLTDNSEAIY
jgi:VIT1/CCC1 family predicted Fe2+/Mn2+ transporter